MIKWIFLFCVFFNFSCFAQENIENLKNVKYAEQGQSVTVQTGEMIVFTKPKKVQEIFEPQSVTWKPELKKVQIKTFGGDSLEVPFVTHIPSFSIFIQILPDKNAVITERIAFINQTSVNDFVRSYPVVFKDAVGKDIRLNRDFLYSKYNDKTVNVLFSKDEKKESISFFADAGLSSGIHLFETSYVIKDAVLVAGNTSRLFISLLGTDNPYLTERMRIFVTYPNKTRIFQAKAFYGINNQISDKAGDFYKDENGRLLYKQNGLLPSGVDLKIEVLANADGFLPQNSADSFDFYLNHYAWLIATLLGALVIYLYLFFSAVDLQDNFTNEKFLTKVRKKIKFDCALFRPLIKAKIDMRALMVSVLQLMDKGALNISFTDKDQIVLEKNKKSVNLTWFEKSLMHFIFPFFIKKRTLDFRMWHRKKVKCFRKILTNQCRKQASVLMYREKHISGFLFLISLGLVIYLGVSWKQFILSVVILTFAWKYSLDLLLKKAHLLQQLVVIFKAYLLCPKKAERQLLLDIALEEGNRSSDRTLNINFHTKKIPLGVFEKMFLYHISKGEKNEET